MDTKTYTRGILVASLFCLLLANLIFGARLYSQETPDFEQDDAYNHMALLAKVMQQIRDNYVDQDKTRYKDLFYGAMRGMLQSLDAHSQFLDPEMYSGMRDDTSGHFGGLGIVISVKDGLLTIVSPMEDTPGFKAGLEPGDHIIEIDEESTEGLSLSEAVKKLRGVPGTRVKLKILRPSTQEFDDLEVTRSAINIPSVKDVHVMDNEIGYIRITQFNDPTADKLQEALDQILANGAKALILDLRNNPGGLLSSAVDVTQKFLNRGDMVVNTKGREGHLINQYVSRGRHHYTEFPMVILVNGGSASASEIVSGALQDHKRAILLGERTFGKGSVQSVLPLNDGSAIRLTTAKYYTPSEKVIHEKGIEPDIVVPMSPETWRKLLTIRARPDHPSLKNDPEFKDVVDVQLEHAIDVLNGIMIFEAHNGGDTKFYASRKK